MEGVNSIFDYFSPSLMQTSTLAEEECKLRPVSMPVQGAPIEFFYPGSPEYFLDLSQSTLHVACKIVIAANGNNTAAPNLACPINNVLHSMFQSVEIEFNGKKMTDSNNLYAYRAYLEDVLSFPTEVQTTQLQMQGFYRDKPGQMDTMAHDGDNTGYVKRVAIFNNSAVVHLCGRLHADVFNMSRALPRNIDMKISLTPSKNRFLIKTPAPDGAGQVEYAMHIMDVYLLVHKLTISNALALAITQHQQKQNLHFPLKHVAMKTLSIPTGQSGIVHDQVYMGQLPNKVVIMFLRESAMTGHCQQNPFNFMPININFFCMRVNGKPVPAVPYTPDFATNDYMRELLGLYKATNSLYADRTPNITREDFIGGYCVFPLEFVPDTSSGVSSPPKAGSTSLEVKFSAPTGHTVNIICYAQFEGFFEIDKYNNVITSFS